jgi:hypothetical protein
LLLAVLGCGWWPATGCVPGVAWLPDSSGFYYTGGKDCQKLYHFDLAKGKARLLNAKTDTDSVWPAVSPDGKQLALARLVGRDRDPSKLQVALFDRDGKELKRSKMVPWRKKVGEYDQRQPPQLFWSPQGDKILVLADQNTGIFDVKTEEMNILNDRVGLIFEGTPLRPDGKAFLVTKLGAKGELELVDWDGKKKKIQSPDELFESKNELRTMMVVCPCIFSSRWDGDKANVRWSDQAIRVDTKKDEATLEKIKPELAADKKVLQHRYQFPKSNVEILLVEIEKGIESGKGDSPYKVRIEVMALDAKKPKIILEKAEACVFIPSPDRKTVVIRCSRPLRKGNQDLLLIVNHKGEVMERIDAWK